MNKTKDQKDQKPNKKKINNISSIQGSNQPFHERFNDGLFKRLENEGICKRL